ncbi:hypothetical protein P168DRAFT_279967 [Aspergillus campestris IBT 28561]|uniref:Uncharacterized protein n=1 Tax=Aspergillus campestris (strain IBT 28561) TaxID=1392248 RepID=A0A2I1D9K7_ASPC2|nr:uncharacterized protein P168DRAFT_279967 [Aspergillus campestris IBT 28561]PKY06550.1 hypothetical protein P168DRAFT_279967 [Aspergillus campestris IBT 28561]
MELCSFMLLALTTALLTVFQPVALNSICPSCTFAEQVELITGTLAVALDEGAILPSSWNLSPVLDAQPCASNETGCFTEGAFLAPVDPVLGESTSDPAYGLPPLLEVNGRQGPSWLDQAGQLIQPVADALAPALSLTHHNSLLQVGLLWTAIMRESCIFFRLIWASVLYKERQDAYAQAIEEIKSKQVQAIEKITLVMTRYENQVSMILKQFEKEQERLCTDIRDNMLVKMDVFDATLNTQIEAEINRQMAHMAAVAGCRWVQSNGGGVRGRPSDPPAAG